MQPFSVSYIIHCWEPIKEFQEDKGNPLLGVNFCDLPPAQPVGALGKSKVVVAASDHSAHPQLDHNPLQTKTKRWKKNNPHESVFGIDARCLRGSFASHVLKFYCLLGGGPRMGETLVYGGVEGGGTHSTVMIFDKVNIWLSSPTKVDYDAEICAICLQNPIDYFPYAQWIKASNLFLQIGDRSWIRALCIWFLRDWLILTRSIFLIINVGRRFSYCHS